MQGKAALCEVDAAFKKLHEELDQRKAKVIEEVKGATSQKEKELLFQKDDLEFVVVGLRHVLEVGEVMLSEGSEGDIVVGKVQIAQRVDTLLGIPLASEPVCDETIAFEVERDLVVKRIREIGSVNKSRSVRTGKAEGPKSVYHRDYAKVAKKPVLKFGKKGTEDGEFQTPYFIASNSRGDHCRGQTQSSCSSV